MRGRDRPNFLLISTDQQRADHVGSYGNDILKTPAIDSIAARGCSFDRFYVATPICMPNRATIMTGRMPSNHGVRRNGVPLRLDSTTMGDLMRAGGYRTALIGKSHLQTMTDLAPQMTRDEAQAGRQPPDDLKDERKRAWSDGRYDQEMLNKWREDPAHHLDLPFYGFDHVELCTMHGDLVHGDYYRWLAERTKDPDALRGPDNALPNNEIGLPQAYRTRVPEELYPTRYIEERCLDYLDTAAKEDEPFMLHCSFPDPHHPFTPPGKYWDMYDPAEMPVPESLRRMSPEHLTPPLRQMHSAEDANRNSTVAFTVSEREAQEAIALTYGMIAMIDDAVGRLLARLDELGLRENTVVIFTSDHGDFMGDHGLMLKAALHYQGLVRVPFIWSDPEHTQGATRSSALCGSVDIARSVLDRAGLKPYYGMQGTSMMPAIRGETRSLHDAVLIEEDGHAPAFGMTGPIRARTVITDRYRLSVYDPEPWVELYDLESDPQEMVNLADDPAHADLRSEMFEALARQQMSAVDIAPFPVARA